MNEKELKAKIKEAMEEYIGYPPDGVPRWVDYDLAVGEIWKIVTAVSVKADGLPAFGD